MNDDVPIDQGVTIGGNATEYGVPIVVNGIYIGAEAKTLGPVIIGSNTVIGAYAVVVTNIPAHCVAAGVPARVIRSGIEPTTFLYHLLPTGKNLN